MMEGMRGTLPFAVSLSPMGGKRLSSTHVAHLESRLSYFSSWQSHPAPFHHPSRLSPSPSLTFHRQLCFQNCSVSDTDHSLLILGEIWKSCPRDPKTHERNAATSSSKQLGKFFFKATSASFVHGLKKTQKQPPKNKNPH